MTSALRLLAIACLCLSLPALADEERPISDKEVRTTVESHMPDIKACMKEHGPSSGKLVVTFTIELDGRVSAASVTRDSANHPLDRCIVDDFRKWTFPKPRGKVAFLSTYPIVFSVPKPAAVGTLSEADVVKTVQAKLSEVQACLADATKDKADTKGTLRAGIVVSPDGSVVEVNVLSSTTGAPKLDSCIVNHVKAWKFPRPAGGGEAAVSYPFKLNE